MKVAQIIPCLGQNSGGPSRSVYELTKGLRSVNIDAEIITNNYLNNPNIANENWIRNNNISRIYPFEYNPYFKQLLNRNEYDLFHIHSIYSYPVTFATRFARKHHKPYIIAPRGSLYGNAISSSSKWKKLLFNRLFLISDLNHASAIHATCIEEMEQIRLIGVTSPIAVIPNSITLPSIFPKISKTKKIRLCFLGRINPIKNIDGLIKAWYQSDMYKNKNAELVIIGDAKLEKEKKHIKELHELEQNLNINNIVWTGNLIGSSKDALLNSCSYLILPSHSENFGMVVVEALIQGVPAITSKGTPWNILEENKCGWWINNSVESMAEYIKKISTISNAEREDMGLKCQQLVKSEFSTPAVSQRIKTLYSWILEGGEKPDFVYL